MRHRVRAWALSGLWLTLSCAQADTLPVVEVLDQLHNAVGSSDAASEGVVSGEALLARPRQRAGDVAEVVPGLAATQHSGDGKANQYFLRGFNLDHGTDVALTVDGMPVNMPTHAHGQGYADLNFLIPELVAQVRYRKGPYAAEDGDFSLAGSVGLDYRNTLPNNLAELTLGGNRYQRGVLAGSRSQDDQHWLAGLEWQGDDGPWQVAQGLRKTNAVLRFSQGNARESGHVSLMAYDSHWTATDQVPQRALDTGELSRFGSLDPSDGGESRRLSLSGQWQRNDPQGRTRLSAYAVDAQLRLWSNFTYFLNNPVQGDQFEQTDSRRVLGAQLDHQRPLTLWGWDGVLSLGASWRDDRIGNVGLYTTQSRVRTGTVREDAVTQDLLGVYAQQMLSFTDHWRGHVGLRADALSYQVDGQMPLVGERHAVQGREGLLSPKLGVAWTLSPRSELYANAGLGFHSNDVRGAASSVDPVSGAATARAPVLVQGRGAELGWRFVPHPELHLTVAVWQLHLDSELVYQGDAGTTEPSRASWRRGLEMSLRWQMTPRWALDLDAALSQARYEGEAPPGEGDQVPHALQSVASAGLAWREGPWQAMLRLRHVGERPLDSVGSVSTPAVNLLNLGLRYAAAAHWRFGLDVFNLTDATASDIEYLYASCTAREVSAGTCGAGITGVHVHPMAPRTVRLSARLDF